MFGDAMMQTCTDRGSPHLDVGVYPVRGYVFDMRVRNDRQFAIWGACEALHRCMPWV